MPTAFDFDLFVIGAGSGGVRAARTAAGLGARVGIAEERYFGGTCVNVGCIPKKLFAYAAHFHEDFAAATAYGWAPGTPQFDWATLVRNKDREIVRLNGVYQRLLRESGVDIVMGHARLDGPHTVSIGDRRVTAANVLIATGGWPAVPAVPGREHVLSSNEIFALPLLPPRITVVGGGYIAVEFAGIFNGLGVDTTLLYRGPLFLRGFDDEVRASLAGEMRRRGVRLQFDSSIISIARGSAGLTAQLADGSVHHADAILYATGRRPLTAGLGLEQAGVQCTPDGAVVVDHHYRTSVPSVHAVGDVIDRVQLTPVALAEGMLVARRLFGPAGGSEIDYQCIPTAVFSQPNVAAVGLTEADARDRYESIRVFKSKFTPLKATLTGTGEQTFMKMIVDSATDRVVGLHMVGADAGEIVQGMAVAMRAGATKADFDSTIGIHPTAAEEFVTMRTPASGT